jgi:NAD(P)H-hydrate epimerase
LLEADLHVTAYVVSSRRRPDPHADRFRDLGGEVIQSSEDAGGSDLQKRAGTADIVVDAVLGTGFRLPLRGEIAASLAHVAQGLADRRRRPLVVAVDCPSGVDCDTGAAAAETLEAAVTVTLAAVKPGLLRSPGASKAGDIVVGDIGLNPRMRELSEVQMELADPKTIGSWLPARPDDGHKGTFGKVIITAGSVNYPGSAALAGLAAYRVGAGLVCLAVPGGIQSSLVAVLPEATWLILPQETGVLSEAAADILRASVSGAKALLIGPGLGREDVTRRFLLRLLRASETTPRGHIGFIPSTETPHEHQPLPPLVVDADGLRLLSQLEEWPKRLPAGSILTPHPGEMSALAGLPTETIQANREGIAREKALEWGHVVVLKGARTVVAAPDGRAWLVPIATAALAKAGTGDVLAGAIVGLCAQGVAPAEASALAAFLHGRAGILAAERAGTTAGVLASDVASMLPAAIGELRQAAS